MEKILSAIIALAFGCIIALLAFGVVAYNRPEPPTTEVTTNENPKEETKKHEEMNENKIVWVVRYDSVDFADCDGVFETKEKAQASVLADAERCKDIWENFQKEETVNNWQDWESYTFVCDDKEEGVTIYKTEIQ